MTAYKRLRRSRSSAEGRLPQGWNEERAQRVLAHYETQSGTEALAEDEAAFEMPGQAVMAVPNDLVPAIRQAIARDSKRGPKAPGPGRT